MLNIIGFLLNFIEQYTVWIYLGCFIIILFYLRSFWIARRERANTIFTIERELAAHREGRAMSSIGVILGVVVVVTALKYYVMPVVEISALIEPTPTVTLVIPTRQPTATPTMAMTDTPTPTMAIRVTRAPAQPTATPVPTLPPPPPCPDPQVCITVPRMGAPVTGRIGIQGSALNSRFQFYKVELGIGENPTQWHSISPIHKNPVDQGLLDQFDTTTVPNGVYWLRLTVVDETGNYPQPYDVRVIVQN